SFVRSIFLSAPLLMSCVAFVVYVFVHHAYVIDVKIAFVSLSFFYAVRLCGGVVPETFALLSQTVISLRRIEKFLNAPEIEKYVTKNKNENLPAMIRKATFSWDEKSEEEFCLENIDLTCEQNQIICIIGEVGSGKSMLLKGLIGELKL